LDQLPPQEELQESVPHYEESTEVLPWVAAKILAYYLPLKPLSVAMTVQPESAAAWLVRAA